MKTIEVNEVMNASIVVLNNIKSKKLSSVGGKKLAQLRTDKHAAEFILANWDNESILRASIKDADKSQEDRTKISDEVLNIWRKRIEELKPVAKRVKELKKKRLAAAKTSKKTKADISTSEEKEEVSKAGGPVSRKIGDRHPKHPEWLWTEYKPGKFDWRTDPTLRKKVGRKSAK